MIRTMTTMKTTTMTKIMPMTTTTMTAMTATTTTTTKKIIQQYCVFLVSVVLSAPPNRPDSFLYEGLVCKILVESENKVVSFNFENILRPHISLASLLINVTGIIDTFFKTLFLIYSTKIR